jgi:hypothetical protein
MYNHLSDGQELAGPGQTVPRFGIDVVDALRCAKERRREPFY